MTLEKALKRHQVTTIIIIVLFLGSLIGWGYSAGRNSKIDEIQTEKINENEKGILENSRKCGATEHLIAVNNAKLELLLKHFDIADNTE